LRSSGRAPARGAGLAAVAAGALLASCAGGGGLPRAADEAAPAPLFASDEVPGDFLMQQRLRFRWDGREGELDAAVQSACGELTIILFTPFGTPGTVIRQRGREVEVEARQAGALPFAPERILVDVQRTYFVPLPGDAPPDGVHERRLAGQRIEETWRGGRLVERVFHPEAEGGDRVRIRYPHGASAEDPPEAAALESERYGYRLDVTTLARVPVDCAR
jgi:hypothetical protein